MTGTNNTHSPIIASGDREPITDGGRVMWGLERAVDYNSSPDMWRGAIVAGRAKCVTPSRRCGAGCGDLKRGAEWER